ncbi:MAG: hypothetical protein QOI80_1355 [Solirubrobacteraceae bacterium]|nr:hypothetical protein [Solirubrobacteraceae bacterium]
MSVITNTWRFLLQRRLWPVAVLLIAAAVAVPTLLASEPTAVPAPPAAAVKSDRASVLATEPIAARAGDGDRSGRRQVLGAAKNPFKPKFTPTPTPAPVNVKTTATTPVTGASGGSSGGSSAGSTTPAAPGTTAPTTPTTPATPKKKYELNELTVRFGPSDQAGGSPPRKDVKRLQALPSNDLPVLIYLGVLPDKKTAVFLVDSGIVAQGDGTCRPSRTTCETIHMKAGETEFLDVPGDDSGDATAAPAAQYQLDVLKIRKTTTTSAKKARKSLARVSKSGRKIVRARIAGDGPLRYHYNSKTGRLEKLSHKAYNAVVAKAARAARAHF